MKNIALVFALAMALGACGEDTFHHQTGNGGATCNINNGGCPAGSTCSVQSGGQIVCTPNQPAQGICSVNNGGCDINATCVQTGINSRTCACNTNFVGDGMSCTSVITDLGTGFGPGPYSVVVELSSRTGYVNGCAGDQFNSGTFSCWYHPEWDTPALAPRMGTSVSFTIPAMPERTSLEFYFNDCATSGSGVNIACAISLGTDTVTLMKDPNLKVTINGVLVGQSLTLFRDSQRRTGCPNGCPNGRIRLR